MRPWQEDGKVREWAFPVADAAAATPSQAKKAKTSNAPKGDALSAAAAGAAVVPVGQHACAVDCIRLLPAEGAQAAGPGGAGAGGAGPGGAAAGGAGQGGEAAGAGGARVVTKSMDGRTCSLVT